MVLVGCEPQYNHDQPDTAANRQGFEKHLGVPASDAVSNVYYYADALGADSTYQLGLTVHPLRGNHDIMMLNTRTDEDHLAKWLDVGGDKTLQSYCPSDTAIGKLTDVPEHHWEWLNHQLLPYFETETHFFVHANAYAEIPLDEQPNFMLYWEQFHDPPAHESGKMMVCGHTSQKSGHPVTNENAICIDTWACGGGWLSCLHAESGMLWQANERREVRRFYVDELPED